VPDIPPSENTRVLFANDLPYRARVADPFRALAETVAFAANDWVDDRATAWLYGIVVGGDNDTPEDDPDGDPGAAMAAVAARDRWDATQVAALRALHAAYVTHAATLVSAPAGELVTTAGS
jgi:hypothetical protein